MNEWRPTVIETDNGFIRDGNPGFIGDGGSIIIGGGTANIGDPGTECVSSGYTI